MKISNCVIYLDIYTKSTNWLGLRIGLIIQVMESEVDRCLKLKDNDDATDELMSLSPYEMRNLLHHIMSGREFGINKSGQHQSGYNVVSDTDRVSKSIQPTVRKGEALMDEEDDFSSDDQSDDSDHRHGIWMRRRRLDGALNRVPVGFYSKVWMILENCRGILVRGRTLDTFLTQGVSKIFAKFFNLSQIHRFFFIF